MRAAHGVFVQPFHDDSGPTMRRTRGFTLIELMIVVTIIAIISAIAIPNLIAARLNANEVAAISTLRSIATAQAQFQASAKADADRDGTGEFGVFRELSGASDVRDAADGGWSGAAGANQYSLPVLAGAFRGVNSVGEVSRSGYQFRTFLPGAGGVGVTETSQPNVFLVDVDSDLCETTWCTYAWPSSHGTSGNRTFFVNQMGDITGTEDRLYSGGDAISEEEAGTAFEQLGALTSITGRPAIGTVGREHGNVWTRVN